MTTGSPAGEHTWPAEPDALEALHTALEAVFADRPTWPEADRAAMTLAVAEVVANVIEHAQASVLRCRVEVIADRATVTIVDDGVATYAADLTAASAVSDDPLAEGGRGLGIARRLAEVTHARLSGGNRWTVTRTIRRTPA